MAGELPPSDKWRQALNSNDPEVQVYILAERVDTLTKEKEKLERDYERLERRVLKMEKSFDRGAGVILVLPIIGVALGWLVSYWKILTKPWADQ